jgi:site-specific DNA-methyltransferase (adenine-specific)
MWLYGSGFPKGQDVSKGIDNHLGAERTKTRTMMSANANKFMEGIGEKSPWKEKGKLLGYHEHESDEPATEEAARWQGWNTTLKPSYEPIVLARNPITQSVAINVLMYQTGGININECRIGTESFITGRWPANVIHDGSDEVVRLFPQQAGGSSKPANPTPRAGGVATNLAMSQGNTTAYIDSGSAARFFYTAKAGKDDRPHGKSSIIHPTVKPLDLMQYLIRLVCMSDGLVLDPFMGSGSTGVAAIAEGMRFVGVELNREYADLAVGRMILAMAEYNKSQSNNNGKWD